MVLQAYSHTLKHTHTHTYTRTHTRTHAHTHTHTHTHIHTHTRIRTHTHTHTGAPPSTCQRTPPCGSHSDVQLLHGRLHHGHHYLQHHHHAVCEYRCAHFQCVCCECHLCILCSKTIIMLFVSIAAHTFNVFAVDITYVSYAATPPSCSL